jgi:hypothetical protein
MAHEEVLAAALARLKIYLLNYLSEHFLYGDRQLKKIHLYHNCVCNRIA